MTERFWDVVCAALPLWGVLFGLNVVLLVFMALSLFLASPEPGTEQIVVINLVLIGSFLVVLGVTIRRCRLRER